MDDKGQPLPLSSQWCNGSMHTTVCSKFKVQSSSLMPSKGHEHAYTKVLHKQGNNSKKEIKVSNILKNIIANRMENGLRCGMFRDSQQPECALMTCSRRGTSQLSQ